MFASPRACAPLRLRGGPRAAATLGVDGLLRSVLLVATLCFACQPRPEDPAQRYRRFAAAARKGDTGTVWALLSSESQARVRARGKALEAQKPAPALDFGPAQLLLGDLAATAPKVKSTRVATESGDQAVVDVELEGGGRGQVNMRREKDGWRVVLPGG